jgi:hypothetical protein
VFRLGATYTRRQIQDVVGGGPHSYLPHVEGHVVAACQRLDPKAGPHHDSWSWEETVKTAIAKHPERVHWEIVSMVDRVVKAGGDDMRARMGGRIVWADMAPSPTRGW